MLLVKGGQYITGDWQIGFLAVAVYLSYCSRPHERNIGFLGALVILGLGLGYGIYRSGMPPIQPAYLWTFTCRVLTS